MLMIVPFICFRKYVIGFGCGFVAFCAFRLPEKRF